MAGTKQAPIKPHDRARIVFETVHTDRAGETSQRVIVDGDVALLDESGGAVISLDNGLHATLPVGELHPFAPLFEKGRGHEDPQNGWIGGQVLTRDFFATGEPDSLVYMSLRALRKAVREET